MKTRTEKPKLPPITEEEFQTQVLQLAKLLGWRTAHFRPARTVKGWRTAVSGDGKGFPDTVLVRGPRIVFMELKRSGGKLTPEQIDWLDRLNQTSAEVYLYYPKDFDTIERVLA